MHLNPVILSRHLNAFIMPAVHIYTNPIGIYLLDFNIFCRRKSAVYTHLRKRIYRAKGHIKHRLVSVDELYISLFSLTMQR